MSDVVERRRRMTIFRAEDAPRLEETDMMTYARGPDAAPPANLPHRTDDERPAGARLSVLYRQTEEEGGFSLVHVWFKPNWMLPRHTHNQDCLYYVISGEAHLGSQVLRAGDGFFIPANYPYAYRAGPDGVEVLEFRHAPTFDIKILEDKPQFWERFAEHLVTNRDAWSGADIPPSWRGAHPR